MKIEKQNNLCFGANLVSVVPIQKFGKNINASFVKFDYKNLSDIEALKEVSNTWKEGFYADQIFNTACQKFNREKCSEVFDIYALTLQKDSFETLEPKDIMGILEVIHEEQKGAIHLQHIEVKPSFIKGINRVYRGIGTAMIKSLQKLYTRIELIARDNDDVTRFYEKNGFAQAPEFPGIFTWIKDVIGDMNSFFM